jgi:hypothetical protein
VKERKNHDAMMYCTRDQIALNWMILNVYIDPTAPWATLQCGMGKQPLAVEDAGFNVDE